MSSFIIQHPKEVIKKMQEVLFKREKALEKLIDIETLQISKYMVLWKYEDKGYEKYRLLVRNEGRPECPDCLEKHEKEFLISEAETYVNFPPLHINCDCNAGILDENGNVVFMLDSMGLFSKDGETRPELLEYLFKTLKKLLLGDFADEAPTVLTIAINVLLGLVCLDLPFDMRDLAASIIKFDNTPKAWFNLIINTIAFIPLIGDLKYLDQAVDAVEPIVKNGDEAAEMAADILKKNGLGDIAEDIIKNSDEAAEIGRDVVKGSDDAAEIVGDIIKNSDDAAEIGKNIIKNSDEVVNENNEIADAVEDIVKNSDKIINLEKDVIDDVDDTATASKAVTKNINKPNQIHHYATNKNSTYTPQFQKIADKYGLDLDDIWNKDVLPHQGRHPNLYHRYVLERINDIDDIAQGDKEVFLELYEELKNHIKANPDMLYKAYWK